MGEQMSDEMGAPGYPAGDETQEATQQGGDDVQQETEQGGGEGDLDPQNEDAIRRRAYDISQGEHAGTPEENWARAEREILTGEASP